MHVGAKANLGEIIVSKGNRPRSMRRTFYALAAVVVGTVFLVIFTTGASSSIGNSTFGGGDGNLACNDASTTGGGALDWNCLTTSGSPALHVGTDLVRSQSDNSFGQGTKEDNSTVTVVAGSIPPNKSDLTVFYEASQQVGGYTTNCGTAPTPCAHTFIYLAWERSNVLGSANMDFEINKNSNGCPSVAGTCTINRSTGDILVTYDFTNGGSSPSIGLKTWSGSWQDDSTVVAESAINSGSITDTVGQGSTSLGSLDANEFGEASIDLTASGVISAGSCDFGSATTFLKSRSSASFTSEIKDFVSPVSTPLNPCAKLTVVKHANNAAGTRTGSTQAFAFTTSSNLGSGFSLTDTGSDTSSNTKAFSGLTGGTYTVSETSPGPNYALTGVSCVNTGTSTTHGTTSTSSAPNASVSLSPGDDVTCTFTNTQQTGAIKITKVSSKHDSSGHAIPLSGAQFTYALVTGGTAGTATNFPATTGSDGTACVAGLPFGTYRIAESSAPSGYKKDAGTQDVTVNAAGTCASGSTQAAPANSFVDTPLSTITLGFHSLAGTGVTSATVQCTGESAAANLPEGDATKTLGNSTSTLTPGTYTCTVVVDP